jgi:5'-3' exonuclease
MGIKDLNQFLRTNCSEEAIKRIQISQLSGKKIAVDISIYLYKYVLDNTLIESMFSLLGCFRENNIIPIFVFDGKSPAEKKALLEKRKQDKKAAEREYKALKSVLENNDEMDEINRQEIIASMDLLKKQFVYINKEHIQRVKQLIIYFGMTYYDAPGEADELCASLVIKKKVWGVMSEDMDMFVYGCHKVLRYFSLLNQSVVVYSMKLILEELGLTQKEFREICVLSGTDYNRNLNNSSRNNLMNSLKMFKKYRKSIKEIHNGEEICEQQYCVEQLNGVIPSYYDWVQEHTDCIEDYNMLMNIYDIFDLTTERHNHVEIFENIKIMNGTLDMQGMKPLLLEEGFIF